MTYRTRIPPASRRQVIGFIWREATSFVRVRLAVVLLLVVAAGVMAPLGPVALKLMIDRFTENATGSVESIVLLGALYVVSQWLPRSANELRGFVYARAERRIFRTVSERLFAHIMHLPMRYHVDRQTGGIGQTIDNGLQGFQMVLNTAVFIFLPLVVQLATAALILQQLGKPIFVALLVASAGCYAAAFRFFSGRLTGAARTAATAQVDAKVVMTDSILNYETVKFFAAESAVQEKLGRAFALTENAWITFFRHAALNGLSTATISAVFLAAAILYATQQVLTGRMTVGEFVLVNAYMVQMMAPLESLSRGMQALAQGAAMFESMLALLREPPEPSQSEDRTRTCHAGQLEFEHVCLSYRPGRAVLRDVSFRLPAGKTLGIVGASGAGKSTLVRLLVRLYEPDRGCILVDGSPTSTLSLTELRHAIAVVPQDTVLFNDSIGYNIAFGKLGSTMAEVQEAARIAHLHDFIMNLPDRYETKVGERGVKLSGGEKQRVSIARAALKRPRIYVFDEATSSLDSQTERDILENLKELSSARTTLIIAHRLSTVVHADEIVVLDGGAIVERGDHGSLIRMSGRYAALWRAQQQQPGTVATPLSA